MEITQERLRALFDYDPLSGHLVWKSGNHRFVGRRAGNMMKRGYRQVSVDGRAYYEHRLVWVWNFGPTDLVIDHINRDRADNRISNLRTATQSQNLARKLPSNRQGLPSGIYLPKAGTSYCARVQGQYLGSFPTVEDAVVAHKAACERLGFFTD